MNLPLAACAAHLTQPTETIDSPATFGSLAEMPELTSGRVACSGGTPDHPGLLQYTVQLKANIRPVKAAGVSAAAPGITSGSGGGAEAIQRLLTGRPVIAFAFDNMQVSESPGDWHHRHELGTTHDHVQRLQHLKIGHDRLWQAQTMSSVVPYWHALVIDGG